MSTAALMDTAVLRVQQELQQDWKQKIAATSSALTAFPVRVNFSSPQEWAETKRALERVSGMTDIALKSLTPHFALVDLMFQGDEARLRLALQQSEMTINAPVGPPAFGAPPVYEVYLNRLAPAAAAPDGGHVNRF